MILNSNIWTFCFDVKSIGTGDFCSLSPPGSVEPCHDAWRKRNGNKKSMKIHENLSKSMTIHKKKPKLFQFPSTSFDQQSSFHFHFVMSHQKGRSVSLTHGVEAEVVYIGNHKVLEPLRKTNGWCSLDFVKGGHLSHPKQRRKNNDPKIWHRKYDEDVFNKSYKNM